MNTAQSPAGPLPADFVSRLNRIVPDRWQTVVRSSFDQAKRTGFRINTLKTGPDEVIDRLEVPSEPVPWHPPARTVAAADRPRLTHSPLVSQGVVYVQGLSSILGTLVLDPQPGEQVLDLAAAPGGKAAHLAALMNNQGWLSVVEPVRRRMFVLADNLKRAGVSIAHTYLMDGRKAGQRVPDRFDRVMLDAPCSGEARFRTDDPSTWQYWSERKIREQARKQRGLIRSAFQALRPGGRLLYCTCSFAPEENEAIVASLLDASPSRAELVPIDLPLDNWQSGLSGFGRHVWSGSLANTRRILPNQRHDGFFMALIAKT